MAMNSGKLAIADARFPVVYGHTGSVYRNIKPEVAHNLGEVQRSRASRTRCCDKEVEEEEHPMAEEEGHIRSFADTSLEQYRRCTNSTWAFSQS